MGKIVKFLSIFLALTLSVTFLPPAPARAAEPGPCHEGTLPHGARAMVCIPASGWNGDLVVYAHGYVAFNEPLDFYHLTLPSSEIHIPTLIQGLGFAFATTSYRQNGLTIQEGVEDIRNLVLAYREIVGVPGHTYLAGVSEGGIIATLAAERYPELFSGALATCGPIGNFKRQIEYIGDFRVLFDYFFPGLLPSSPIVVPPELIDNWKAHYVPLVREALVANPEAAYYLIATSGAPIDSADPATVLETAENVLWYQVFGTSDAAAKLGGNPYGNLDRVYSGSPNDESLNAAVQRFAADPAALNNLAQYETSGHLTIPVVTLHTLGDEVIPFPHELFYLQKLQLTGRGVWIPLPVFRYGHCNFQADEVQGAFGLLLFIVAAQEQGGSAQTAVDQMQSDSQRVVQEISRSNRPSETAPVN